VISYCNSVGNCSNHVSATVKRRVFSTF